MDQELPFSEHLPKFDELPPHNDLVIGGDLAWKHILSNSSLTWNDSGTAATHELGLLWLSSADQVEECILEELLYTGRLSNLNITLSSKIRYTPADRQLDMHKLETDPCNCSPNDDKPAMSRADESVWEAYKDTVKLVESENEENHLQFSLPWAQDPSKLPNNY